MASHFLMRCARKGDLERTAIFLHASIFMTSFYKPSSNTMPLATALESPPREYRFLANYQAPDIPICVAQPG